MEKERLIQEIVSWIKDYEDNEEHDTDLAINLKDDAYPLLAEALKLLSR